MSENNQTSSIRKRFLRVSIPLIFVSVAGVFVVIELMSHKSLVEQLHSNLDDVLERSQHRWPRHSGASMMSR